MKFFVLGLILLTAQSWAKTSSQCEVVSGFYKNSSTTLTDIKFETLADVFSLNNAKTLSFLYEGKEIRFQRNDIDVKRYTKMQFLGVQKLAKDHAARITIDRSPKEALKAREFYASMMVLMPLEENTDGMLTYNLYCKF